MNIKSNEVENCLLVITESIKTMNHNSTRTADALDGIKDTLSSLNATQQVSQTQHIDILKQVQNVNNNWFKILIIVLIGVFALVGIKLGGLI